MMANRLAIAGLFAAPDPHLRDTFPLLFPSLVPIVLDERLQAVSLRWYPRSRGCFLSSPHALYSPIDTK
jgi:hypothetical protein